MKENVKRWWWKLNRNRNYDESKDLTDLVYRCIWLIENCPNVTVEITQYYLIIKTSTSHIQLWNENKFYAWLCRGTVNGRNYDRLSPSLDAMYDFKNYLEEKGYNIYVPQKPDAIDLQDVKC